MRCRHKIYVRYIYIYMQTHTSCGCWNGIGIVCSWCILWRIVCVGFGDYKSIFEKCCMSGLGYGIALIVTWKNHLFCIHPVRLSGYQLIIKMNQCVIHSVILQEPCVIKICSNNKNFPVCISSELSIGAPTRIIWKC